MLIIKKYNTKKIDIKIKYDDNIIGNIYGIINNNNCNLISLIIKEGYREYGFGTLLLKIFIRICKNKKIKKIELDDMTDNFNKKNNIYLKNGFRYIKKGFPEMILKC
jgi:ribosomal protein S18 acetylase RimI-like enzyme